MKNYSIKDYRGNKFINKKVTDINNKIVTRKCNLFIEKVSVMFNEIENIKDDSSSKHQKKKYFAKSIAKQLQTELYCDIQFGSQIEDAVIIKSLKDGLYGYIKFRASQYYK